MKRLVCMDISMLAPVAAGTLHMRFPVGDPKPTGSLSSIIELLTALFASFPWTVDSVADDRLRIKE